jgi:hypothetical protein
MGYNLTPVIVDDNVNGSSWIERLRRHALANAPRSSGDIEVRQGPSGTSFHIQPGVIPLLSLNYKMLNDVIYTAAIPSTVQSINAIDPLAIITSQVSDFFSVSGRTDSAWWSTDNAYAIGDMVRIQSFLNGSAGGVNPDTGNSCSIVAPSTWICVSPVPYNYSTADKAVISGITDPTIKALASALTRSSAINYYPIWEGSHDPEEPKQVAHKTTDGKGRYWEMISAGATTSGGGGDVWL